MTNNMDQLDLGAHNQHLTAISRERSYRVHGNNPLITPLEPGTKIDAVLDDKTFAVTIDPSEALSESDDNEHKVLAHLNTDNEDSDNPEAIVIEDRKGSQSVMDREWNVQHLDKLVAGRRDGAKLALKGAGVSVQNGGYRKGFTVAKLPVDPVSGKSLGKNDIKISYKI